MSYIYTRETDLDRDILFRPQILRNRRLDRLTRRLGGQKANLSKQPSHLIRRLSTTGNPVLYTLTIGGDLLHLVHIGKRVVSAQLNKSSTHSHKK
jgi:hypothetical protein